MKKISLQVIIACSMILVLRAADDPSQAELIKAVALQHTMKSANFSNDAKKMFGVTTNGYAVLYDIEKKQCQYQQICNDVRSMRYYDDTEELLICDQHRTYIDAYYMQVIRARLKTGKKDAVYNALKKYYTVFNCSASYNKAKDKVLVVEPRQVILVNERVNKGSVLLSSACASIQNAFYVNDDLLLVQADGDVGIHDVAKLSNVKLFQETMYPQGHEWLKSVTHNDTSILLHTSKKILKYDVASGKQQIIEPNASEVDQAVLHPMQAGEIVLLQNREVIVKDAAGQTKVHIASPLYRYASRICSIYKNLLLLLSTFHQEVTLCDLATKQSRRVYKGDRSKGTLLQAMLCAENKIQIATSKNIFTYDIPQQAS